MSSPVDVKLYTATNPPCMVPVSERAKRMLHLPAGVDGVITTEDPEIALAIVPGDFNMELTTEAPKVVAIIEKLSLLH